MDSEDLFYFPDEIKFMIASYLNYGDGNYALMCIWELPLLEAMENYIEPENLKWVDRRLYPYIVYELESYDYEKIDKNIKILTLKNIKDADVYKLPEILIDIQHLEYFSIDLTKIETADSFNFILEVIGNIKCVELHVDISEICIVMFDQLVSAIKKTSAIYLSIQNKNLDFNSTINLESLDLEGFKLKIKSFLNLILPESILYLDIEDDLIGAEKIVLDVHKTKIRHLNVPLRYFNIREAEKKTSFPKILAFTNFAYSFTHLDKKTGEFKSGISFSSYSYLKISESKTPINLMFGERSLLPNPEKLKYLEIGRPIEYLGFYGLVREDSKVKNKVFSVFKGYNNLKELSFVYSNINYFLNIPGSGIVNLLPKVEQLEIIFTDYEKTYESKIIIPESVNKLTIILYFNEKIDLGHLIANLIEFENINKINFLMINEHSKRNGKTIIKKSDIKKIAEVFHPSNITEFTLFADLVDEHDDPFLLEDLLILVPKSVIIISLLNTHTWNFMLDFRKFTNLKMLDLSIKKETSIFEKYIIKLPESLAALNFNPGKKDVIIPGIHYCCKFI